MRALSKMAITVVSPPSRAEAQIFVVARSIPNALAIFKAPFTSLDRGVLSGSALNLSPVYSKDCVLVA